MVTRKKMKLCKLPCPKCEAVEVNVHFHEANRDIYESRETPRFMLCDSDVATVKTRIGGFQIRTKAECLLHWCTKCQYNWWTACADREFTEMLGKLKTL